MAEEPLKYIRFALQDNVGVITLNRPDKLNAVSWALAAELAALLASLRTRDEVRALVLTGEGRSFCAGGDVEWLSGEGDQENPMPGTSDPSRPMPRKQRISPGGPFFEVTRQLMAVDKPVIAAIHGHAVGAGLAYALACDRRFGDSTTKMGAVFVNVAMPPDCGVTWFLPRVVGLPNALMMIETGRIFKAEECRQLGLIDELVPEGKDLEAALEYAHGIAQKASVAVEMGRRLVYLAQTNSLEQQLDYEGAYGVLVAGSADAAEGTKAFMEKRKPVFRGI